VVGAGDGAARGGEHPEGGGGGVSVAVVSADRDEGEARVQGGVQARALVGGAVVGDLDDVDRADAVPGEERILAGLAEVAEEDRAHPVAFDGDRDAAGVAA